MEGMKHLILGLILLSLASVAGAQTLTTAPTVHPGDPVVVTFVGAPGNSHDYIGIFHAGAPDPNPWPGQIVEWNYTSGTQNPSTTKILSGSVTFPLALATGDYEARFFPNDALISTTRIPFSVHLGAVTITGVNPRLQWDQGTVDPTQPLSVVQALVTRLFSDVNPAGVVVAPSCAGTVQPYRCSAPVGTFPVGDHWVSLTVSDASGTLTTAPTPQLLFSVQMVCQNCPTLPVNVTLVPGLP
jgi:hypothetical protein